MVHRDPETGKFVADEGGGVFEEMDRETTISGGLSVNIPAADLGGGNVTETVDGDDGELVNLSNHLDADEVFEARLIIVDTFLGLPTTATAEGSALVSYQVQTDLSSFNNAEQGLFSGFYGGATTLETGIADVRQNDEMDGSIVHTGAMYAESSALDTTNGVGTGSDHSEDTVVIPAKAQAGRSLLVDEDDEIGVSSRIGIDNVSDHAVTYGFGITMHGGVFET